MLRIVRRKMYLRYIIDEHNVKKEYIKFKIRYEIF